MSAPVTTKDRRKKNFSPEEKAINIEALSKYGACLHGAQSGTTSKVQKDEILLEITLMMIAFSSGLKNVFLLSFPVTGADMSQNTKVLTQKTVLVYFCA